MTALQLKDIAPGHADSDLARYLDFTFDRLDADGVLVRLPPSPAAQDEDARSHIDDRALLATADHCMGVAIHAALEEKAPLATVDLKFEKFRRTSPGEIFLRIGRAITVSKLAFVAAWLDQGDAQRPIGHVSARFMIGAWPGGGAMALPQPLQSAIDLSGIETFASFAGLPPRSACKPRFELAPLERTIGARAVPAFHGGVVAAGLTTAAAALAEGQRGRAAVMANCSIDYLRAALATQALHFDAELISSGRKTMRVRAVARQRAQQQPIAQALVLFAIEQD
ncbi:MAG: hotdog domain-containing protein [Hyphomonadaceae bacterium]